MPYLVQPAGTALAQPLELVAPIRCRAHHYGAIRLGDLAAGALRVDVESALKPADAGRHVAAQHAPQPQTAINGAGNVGRPPDAFVSPPGASTMAFPTPNSDENLETNFLGNFHKTLPHDDFGEVQPEAYRHFMSTCLAIEAGAPQNFEAVPRGLLLPSFETAADPRGTSAAARFTSPMAAAATESHGPAPRSLEMPPAPGIRSASAAAEFIELYWMALLRDVPLADFSSNALVTDATAEVSSVYAQALAQDGSMGAVRLGLDLPQTAGALDIRPATLFRCGLYGEDAGPLVSQFLLRDLPYGVQRISQRQTPYLMNTNFLTEHADWLRAQNTGKDKWGRDYANCNHYADQVAGRQAYFPSDPNLTRHISTLRDLARFVNRDALHQAYFNAALILDALGAPLDDGNPYKGSRFGREAGFATLGGPDLLTLVSEVASRALKVVWRQKWLVHRRARPEVYGGLIQLQTDGLGGATRPYGLGAQVVASQAAGLIHSTQGTYYLPMAFSAGSPSHPSYGAGHATVAGACVTVLKAWFDEDQKLGEVINRAQLPENGKEPFAWRALLQPGARIKGEAFDEPQSYTGNDSARITVGGELNKLAANVAMGRSMGGVHWRSDNTRSLRLGEQVAIEILRKRTLEYAERPVAFTFRSFDRQTVHITGGQVKVV
jgi:hypothetical protein